MDQPAHSPAGFRPAEWAKACGFSTRHAFRKIENGEVEAVKDGSATIILTPPSAYLASLPKVGKAAA